MLKASCLHHVGTGAHTAGGDPGTRCEGAHSQNRPGREETAGGEPAGRIDPRQGQTDRHTPICHPGSPASAAAQGELDGTKQHRPKAGCARTCPLPWLLPRLTVLRGGGEHVGEGAGSCRKGTPTPCSLRAPPLLPGGAVLPSLALCWPVHPGAADVFPMGHPLRSLSPSLKSLELQGWIFLSLSSPSGWRGWTISWGTAERRPEMLAAPRPAQELAGTANLGPGHSHGFILGHPAGNCSVG